MGLEMRKYEKVMKNMFFIAFSGTHPNIGK